MGTGSFNGVGKSAALTFPDHKAVHHQLDGMLLIFLQFDLFAEVIENAIHTDTGKAGLSGIFEHFYVLAFFTAHNGRKHDKAGTFTQCFHPVNNLVNGLAADFLAAFGTMRHTHPGPQKTQIVIDLRNRTNRRTRILGCGLLIDGNSGRQTVNRIHIRLIHLT